MSMLSAGYSPVAISVCVTAVAAVAVVGRRKGNDFRMFTCCSRYTMFQHFHSITLALDNMITLLGYPRTLEILPADHLEKTNSIQKSVPPQPTAGNLNQEIQFSTEESLHRSNNFNLINNAKEFKMQINRTTLRFFTIILFKHHVDTKTCLT